jgi:DNA (cytosine-5)-methyltransferase 1
MALGLEWAGIGPVKWQVELEEDRRRNLARWWPDADRSVTDIRLAGRRNLARVDLVVATFPCKDLSSAGSRAGLDGPQSGIWFECLRVVAELVPRWVVVENVASGAKNWVPHVRAGLEGLGYACLPVPIAASDCGAPHRRRRVFIVCPP